MTGDGVNDAPALKPPISASPWASPAPTCRRKPPTWCSTDDNFATIVAAVEEGRGIYDNIRKYLFYLLSSNAGELLTMFAGVTFAGVLGLVSVEPGLFLPLLATQLLWINLITDGPPALALGVDPKDPDVMGRPPRRRGGGVLTSEDWMAPRYHGTTGDDGRDPRRARRLLSRRTCSRCLLRVPGRTWRTRPTRARWPLPR